MTTNWRKWHEFYDDPTQPLSRRLETVRALLGATLDSRCGGSTVLVSMCAGDGRDALPVVDAGHHDVLAVLVELDPELAASARDAADRLRLPNVDIRIADAGSLDTYIDIPRADVLLACGVFGNITDNDLVRTVHGLAHLLADDGVVIWTRSDREHQHDPSGYPGDPSELVRQTLGRNGYREEEFVLPTDATYRVGVHRRTPRVRDPAPEDGTLLFTFTHGACCRPET